MRLIKECAKPHFHMIGFVLKEIQMQLGSGLVGASYHWLKVSI